ncbi:unnamed protein product [Caenorhabditis nigoni]|uniref:Uncharacterized protein n=1 Tax=Caenorhabditis nigoni TaxID=1611254 RepID=A0A2G5VVT4_9PELO|nr:hypothetical protein B9Z55_000895 [Caenorhabditis nigoni]
MLSAISDSNKKLSYDCLKCVLQHSDANFRFQLAERFPKINLAEKAVQLFLSDFSISEGWFKLNDINYRLGVIRYAREGPTPETIETENRSGGVQTDIDQFGFEKYSLPELTPGDILIKDAPRESNDNLELAEARLVRYQEMLTDLEKEKMELENVPETPAKEISIETDQLDRIRISNEVLRREERLKRINDSIRGTKRNLGYSGLAVQCYQRKRDNRPFPFEMFIQLTKTSSDGTVYIERFNYDKSLREAQKYLISKFLGNRQLVTKIKSLRFLPRQREGLIFGLPEGIKLDVQEITTSLGLADVLQRVETILEHPNRPFTRLRSGGLTLVDAQNPKIRNARVLELYNSSFVECVALCREVPNKRIVIHSLELHPEQFGVLVENLINTRGTLGTCFEFTGIQEKDEAREALSYIAERFETSVAGKRLVTISLPHQQLNISYAAYRCNPRILEYTIKMEVVQSHSN